MYIPRIWDTFIDRQDTLHHLYTTTPHQLTLSNRALLILKGLKCRKFNLLSDTYKVKTYKLTNLKVFKTITKTQKKNKYNYIFRVNALLKYYNNKACI
jgi:hypothetical protein